MDGRLVGAGAARVPLRDRGFLFGDGVFETVWVRRSRPLFLDRHLERLAQGLRILGVVPAAADEVRQAVQHVAHRSAAAMGPDFVVRANVSLAEDDRVEGDPSAWRVTAFARRLAPDPAERGLRLVLDPEPVTGPPIKSLSFLPHVLARRRARAQGADDALHVNAAGRVSEATTSNVFAVVGGRLHAPGPGEGALPGIVRGVVLEEAARLGLRVRARLGLDALARADELFLTNAGRGVAPVREVVDAAGPWPRVPGPLTRRLGDAFERRAEAEARTPSRASPNGATARFKPRIRNRPRP